MKTIILLRAALSNSTSSLIGVANQPITRKGQVDALRLGTIIQERELLPDLILTSPALRARQMIEIIRGRCGYSGMVRSVDDLYAANQAALFQIIGRLSDQLNRVMIVAHTPGLKEILNTLTEWDKSLPVAGLAYLVIPIRSWREILDLETEALLVELWHPSQPTFSYFMGFFGLEA